MNFLLIVAAVVAVACAAESRAKKVLKYLAEEEGETVAIGYKNIPFARVCFHTPSVQKWCRAANPDDEMCEEHVMELCKEANGEEEGGEIVPLKVGYDNIPMRICGDESAAKNWCRVANTGDNMCMDAVGIHCSYEMRAAEKLRQEAEKEEQYVAPRRGFRQKKVYETEEAEKDNSRTGGCMKKCYYRKYEGGKAKQINCAKLDRYSGRKTCKKNGKVVDCSELRCKLVHEVKVEKIKKSCRRVCYYRPYANSRTKRKIDCADVDTKYVGDKKCAVNGKKVACSELTCNK
jgi:hypothetical protein